MSKTKNNWFTEAYAYERPYRGEIRKGILLEMDSQGALIDVGLKHDGFVPRTDIERLDDDLVAQLELGQEISTKVIRPRDQEGNLILSLAQVQSEKDWQNAQTLFEKDELWSGLVTSFNRGGLLVKFGQLDAFVPASHLYPEKQSKSKDRYQARLKAYVGQTIPLLFIEVDQARNRLIASEQLARKKVLMQELAKDQIRQGVVRNLTNYGAFVDLGGMDGMIHISELSWRRIRHPGELLQVGDEIQVHVLDVDKERERISLSLKQLQSDPWSMVNVYDEGQLISGTITNVVDFGAFVLLDDTGIEGLLHISEIADPIPDHPREFLEKGDKVMVRILNIDVFRHRIGLSLKRVSEAEQEVSDPQQLESLSQEFSNN